MESEADHTHTEIDQIEEHCARQLLCLTEQCTGQGPRYTHIEKNEFLHRRHKIQTEEDIAICECKYDENDPESACGERCLNVLTNTECTPAHCPCGVYCKNQRFQKLEYAKTKLFKTEGRGWGLLANENIKAGQFIIEYSGEVISWKEAKQRSHAYETQGLRDAFIISLNASESIDATEKGSVARFINHSCQPNCETRKWNVLGEIRVGIFAKQDILVGTELAYDYNFEWYGGAKVRCLCGASSCSGFLGAKSRGFQVYRTLSMKGISYIDVFPIGLRPFIQQVKDVCHDGHCGFRAVADLVGLGENGYLQVCNDLLTELSSFSAHYGELYGSTDRVRELAQRLSFFDEGRAPFDRWMMMPDMGHLIASCYKVVLFHLSSTQCLTFLPLRSAPVPLPRRRQIAIGFMNDCHCVEVFIRPGHPVPPITSDWSRYHTPAAQGWDTVYTSCILHFKSLVSSDQI